MATWARHSVMMLVALAMSIAEAQAQSVAPSDDRCSAPSPPMSGASSSGALRFRATRSHDSAGEFRLEGNARIAFAGYLICAGTIYRAGEMKFGPVVSEAFKNALGGRSP